MKIYTITRFCVEHVFKFAHFTKFLFEIHIRNAEYFKFHPILNLKAFADSKWKMCDSIYIFTDEKFETTSQFTNLNGYSSVARDLSKSFVTF